jgi:formyl-CoA transferase
MLDFQAARWLIDGEVPGQAGNNHPTSIPTGVFATKDGHINIAASGDVMWRRLGETLGAPELAEEPDFADAEARSKNRDALNARLEGFTRERTSADWIERLNAAGVPSGPINSIDQVFADPQVEHLGLARLVDHPTLGPIHVVGQAVSLSGTPEHAYSPTPERGEHTDEVLAKLGCDAETIAGLRARDVV